MSTKTAPKTYVMLPETAPTAPIYIQVGKNERIRLNKLPKWSAYLQTSITTEESENKVLRLKLNSNSIYLHEQIEKGILANAKYTNAERDAVKFVNGVLITTNKTVQDFLDAHPQNKAFKGTSNDELQPKFVLEDKNAEVNKEMSEFRRRLRAANFIADMKDLKEAQNLLIHINGTFYTPPTQLSFAQQELITLVEEGENDEVLDKVLAWQDDAVSDVDEINIMIARLVGANALSFTQTPNAISKQVNGEWQTIMEISDADYSVDQRQSHLVTFLQSPNGSPLLTDLTKDYEELNKLEDKSGKKDTKNKDVKP